MPQLPTKAPHVLDAAVEGIGIGFREQLDDGGPRSTGAFGVDQLGEGVAAAFRLARPRRRLRVVPAGELQPLQPRQQPGQLHRGLQLQRMPACLIEVIHRLSSRGAACPVEAIRSLGEGVERWL
jgi:hypothetical protein